MKQAINERQDCVPLGEIQAAPVIVLLMAFGLRLLYAVDISPFSDEYITMLAAQTVWRTGIPVLPSGQFYDHGILFVYVEALFLGLLGLSVDIARVAAAFIGVLTVALTCRIGRQWFTTRTGILSALLLALGSESVVWHGRARMYCLLELSFLAGAFLLYEGFVLRDSRLHRCAGVAVLGCATLSHLLAIPYTATMIVALVLARTWVQSRDGVFPLPVWRLWPELLLGLTAGGVVLLTRLRGGPWGVTGRIATDHALLADVGHLALRGIA